MVRNTITCSVEGCERSHTEDGFNQGHPGWGHFVGIIDECGEAPHFCPACKDLIYRALKGELK